MKKDTFYVWNIPFMWTVFTIISFSRPGNDYGLFIYGAIVGSWVRFIHPVPLTVKGLFYILPVGVAILGLLGYFMDRLRVRRAVWTIFFFLSLGALFGLAIMHYGSMEMMVMKEGAVKAVLFPVCSWAVYASVVMSILLTAPARVAEKMGDKETKYRPPNNKK